MGAPFGNRNAAGPHKKRGYGQKSTMSQRDVRILSMGFNRGWRSSMFTAASKRVSARKYFGGSVSRKTKFIHNLDAARKFNK